MKLDEILKTLGVETPKNYTQFFSNGKFKNGTVLSFTKDKGTWYIDLPKWPLSKTYLAMIAGADTCLDKLSKNTRHVEVKIFISSEKENHPDAVELRRIDYELLGGAHYETDFIDSTVWLCPVTIYVMGIYPKYIYFERI